MNEYLRKLNWTDDPSDYPMWQEDGNILTTPDGIRWRIEQTPTVGDLVHVGDTISTSYDTGGLVINVHHYSICCCPYRAISTTKLCYESWDPPKQTMKYHRELPVWSIIFVESDAVQFKSGKFRESDYCYLNELVCVGGRILQLFEANDDETFVIKDGIENHLQLPLF